MAQPFTLDSDDALRSDAAPSQPRAAEAASPCWFGDDRHTLFGFYHSPAQTAPQRRLGVVLCNPFGYEAMCAHRPYRQLAEQLATAGFAVLRFDYHGTGSSSGSDADPERVRAWQESIERAIEQLRERSGCARVALFGARLGATLALMAAASRSDVSALVLWGPSFTGQSFLREELAVHKLHALRTNESRDAVAAGPQDIEALGFVITAQTAAELKALSLSGVAAAPPAALVLSRDTPLQEPRVAAQLSALGADVTSEAGPGYAHMIDHSGAPHALWDRIGRYLEQHDAALPRELAPCSPDAGSLGTLRARIAAAHASHPLQGARTEIYETPMYFGPDQRLFGILTEGAGQATRHGRPAPVVLLLSGGVNPQVGTNRMHTSWARRWAAEGITSFRFDLSGIGDSGNAAGGQDSQLYSVDTVSDVQAAMDHLTAIAGAKRFVLIGLCSGAFAAFHTALADVRVESIALLNLLRFYWSAEDTVERVQAERRRQMRSVRYYVSALFWPSTWRKLASGTVNLRAIAAHMTLRAGRRVHAIATYYTGRLGFPGAPPSKLASDFRGLARRGLKSLVIYDGHEPMLDDFRDQLGSDAPRLRALGMLELAVIDGSDHIFSPVRSQRVLAELLSEHVRARVLG